MKLVGMLRAISSRQYGVFNKKGESLVRFFIGNPEDREDVNKFLDKKVNYEKDVEPLIEKAEGLIVIKDVEL